MIHSSFFIVVTISDSIWGTILIEYTGAYQDFRPDKIKATFEAAVTQSIKEGFL